ncbi:MAG: linear amide C-N hydrolase [candidate division Zixibacteria bacterium]|nr:linear amide C-N hydrolase [candidate division Zixibacteria bacterium]
MKRACNRLPLPIVLAVVLGLGLHQAYPCSTFVLRGQRDLVFGGNLDFYTSKGLVVVNKRQAAKTAMLAPPETPVSWVSRYGSISFNQVGKEFPFGGMNEKGLVVQMMWLDETAYPPADERPGITELQWIQYQLDNAATVDEVIQSDRDLRISNTQAMSRLHYLVSDASGKAAAIEFIDGRFVCHTGETLPVAALTNSSYDESLEFHLVLDTLGAAEQVAHTSYDSKDRFATIARKIRDFESEKTSPAVDYAFDMLKSVSAPRRGLHCTAWSIVYDVANRRLQFKTFENRDVRVIDFDTFDFACAAPTMVLDMSGDLKGDVSAVFAQYRPEMNRDLVASVMAIYKEAGFMSDMPDMAIQFLVGYPATVVCREADTVGQSE